MTRLAALLDLAPPTRIAERDPTAILYALAMMAGALLILWATVRVVKRPAKEPPQPPLEEPRAEDPYRASTAPPQPSMLKCRHCEHDAKFPPYKWVRDRGVFDLVRRAFGAPATLRIGRDVWAKAAYCEVHIHLAYEEFRKEQTEYDNDRAKFESAWETRRARFQRDGVHERVNANIEQHQRQLGGRKRRGATNVVPFELSRQTGTDQK